MARSERRIPGFLLFLCCLPHFSASVLAAVRIGLPMRGWIHPRRQRQLYPAEDCPCRHHGIVYGKGDTIKVDCNVCTSGSGAWSCNSAERPGTCRMYGDGHYITFDGKRFVFDGNCDSSIVQDYCSTAEGNFQIITGKGCSAVDSSCSKAIRFYIKVKSRATPMAG
ncbi:mucin-6-like [Petromyzon marinus]|uniref:mucin-6-like n=2 Tax=Petromyzon marinus TaxID=7757 RepID=UPI003F7171E5